MGNHTHTKNLGCEKTAREKSALIPEVAGGRYTWQLGNAKMRLQFFDYAGLENIQGNV